MEPAATENGRETPQWKGTGFVSDEIIPGLVDELRSIKMTTSQDPHEYFLRVEQLRVDLATHKEPVSDRRDKDIITNGMSDEYPNIMSRLPFSGTRNSALTTFATRCGQFTEKT